MKNIPNKIYLQVDPDGEKPGDFNELEAISWYIRRVNDSDIPYYRRSDKLIKGCLPETFYAALNSEERLKMLVAEWQKAIKILNESEDRPF